MQQNCLKTIGVLGGMGPMATVELMTAIIANTLADCDQKHPPLIVDSNTKIADRTAFLLGKSNQDPRSELIAAAKRLTNSGVACIIMPCNTAHAFYTDIVENAGVPVLHMIEETAIWIVERYPDQKKIGVLATQGTYSADIYRTALEKFGLTQITPDKQGQEEITKAIYYGIKANNSNFDYSLYRQTISQMKERQGVEVFILGCTELSVAQRYHPLDEKFADPLQIIARSALEFVGATLTDDSARGN
jgi:aspartate racemase